MVDQRLVCLFYLLMRDVVLPGKLEQIVMDIEKIKGKIDFSNKHLENYAEELIKRLEKV